jgi:aminoglycoside 6'-N-acetyltransferase I
MFRGAAATDGDQLVGMLLGQIEGWIDGDLFFIQEMCVAPSRQNVGIGTRLLEYALAQIAVTDQVIAAYLLTDGGSRSEAFYSRHGFCRSGSKVVLNLRLKQPAGHR